jgi:hypothetical protein
MISLRWLAAYEIRSNGARGKFMQGARVVEVDEQCYT